MKTVSDNVDEMANSLCLLLEELLSHSSIYQWNTPDSSFIGFGGDYAYQKLGEAGQQVQTRLLEQYRRFFALLNSLLQGMSKDAAQAFKEADSVLMKTIEQEYTWCKTTQEAFEKAAGALQTQVNLLKRLYDPSEGKVVYIPDTNALLYNPRLETWAFPDTPLFTILLLPAVLSELDALKINHRNEDVRQKAETLIRQIKEYRRRGRLTEGVPLVSEVSDIVAVATEPDFGYTLPWLDPDNIDDRFLGGVIEVMRARSRSPVIIVSRDINLQNKAEFARLPFVEPPDPV